MEILGNQNNDLFVCNNCNFKCKFMSDWKRHLNTRKHERICLKKQEIHENETPAVKININKCPICNLEFTPLDI